MKIDTAGNYTLRYTAEDECGNETVVDRSLVVVEPRTVLYADGTLIINELPADMEENEQLHGVATNVYIPFDPNSADTTERYEFFGTSDVPWHSQASAITSCIIGSPIEPKKTGYWFSDTVCTDFDFRNLLPTNFTDASNMFNACKSTNIDTSTLNTSNVTNMMRMFRECKKVRTLNISTLNTRNVTSMEGMFSNWNSSGGMTVLDLSSFDTTSLQNCSDMFSASYYLTEIDLSSFNTSNVTNMWGMFKNCQNLATIYASTSFVTDAVSQRNSTDMFANSTNIHRLVGGAGTAWSSSNPTDKTYARIDNPPDAPGYFTLKTA